MDVQILAFVAIVVALVFSVGYKIYSEVLKQMATNAKNKRILKNEVTHWTGREYRRSKRQ